MVKLTLIRTMIISGGTAAMLTGLVWFMSYIPAFLLSMDINMSVALQIITCLSINSAMSYGFQLLFIKESNGGMYFVSYQIPRPL